MTNPLVTIDQPGLFLGSESYYEWNDKYAEQNEIFKTAYKNYFADLAFQTCKDSGNSNCDRNAFFAEAEKVYKAENELASISDSGVDRSSDEDLTWNKMTISAFENVENVKVEAILKRVFQPVGYDIDSSTEINVRAVAFFEKFNDWINKQDLATLNNLFVFRSTVQFIESLPDSYKSIRDDFNLVYTGTSKRRERYEICIDETINALPFPTSVLYLNEAYPPEAKADTEVMVDYILQSFSDVILDEQNDWMDAETKVKAHEKVDAVSTNIGYPDYIIDESDTRLDDDFADLAIDQDMYTNYVNLLAFNHKNRLNVINSPIDNTAWDPSLPPAIVNAFYDPTQNSINFPAGILQYPFYDNFQSMATNFGGIGVVIGHELTHGFDDSGALYGPTGNKENWWGDSTRVEFNKRGDAMAEQYSSYYWDQAKKNVNGRFTLGENIADNGGLRESFFAYKQWLQDGNTDITLPGMEEMTWEQKYFLGYAQVWCTLYTDEEASKRIDTDVHSPAPFRVQGPLSNFDEFGKAFQCEQGKDVYFPKEEDQVRVW